MEFIGSLTLSLQFGARRFVISYFLIQFQKIRKENKKTRWYVTNFFSYQSNSNKFTRRIIAGVRYLYTTMFKNIQKYLQVLSNSYVIISNSTKNNVSIVYFYFHRYTYRVFFFLLINSHATIHSKRFSLTRKNKNYLWYIALPNSNVFKIFSLEMIVKIFTAKHHKHSMTNRQDWTVRIQVIIKIM